MLIFNKPEIEKFVQKHTITAKAFNEWIRIIEESEWKDHNDLKRTLPSADYVGNARYVFNIKGNGFRVVAVVLFVAGSLTVRFVGTHSEYDKIDCRTI
jgi:mRNA interferase HigB